MMPIFKFQVVRTCNNLNFPPPRLLMDMFYYNPTKQTLGIINYNYAIKQSLG